MIPDKVKIGIYNYDVKETDDIIIVDNRVCSGSITYDKLEIKLTKDRPIQKKYQTLLHEIVHGIIREYDLDLKKHDEETVVDTLAIGIYQVLMDNELKLK